MFQTSEMKPSERQLHRTNRFNPDRFGMLPFDSEAIDQRHPFPRPDFGSKSFWIRRTEVRPHESQGRSGPIHFNPRHAPTLDGRVANSPQIDDQRPSDPVHPLGKDNSPLLPIDRPLDRLGVVRLTISDRPKRPYIRHAGSGTLGPLSNSSPLPLLRMPLREKSSPPSKQWNRAEPQKERTMPLPC
jgi:hypothetical protein